MDKMLRIELKVVKEEREYILCIPYGASHGETYDAVHEMLQEIVNMAQEQVKQSVQQTSVAPEGE